MPPTVPHPCRRLRTPRCSSRFWSSLSTPIDVTIQHAMRFNILAASSIHRLRIAAGALSTALVLGTATPASAQLKIEITSGVIDPIPIAIVPFAHAGVADGGLDVAGVVQHDLEGSGRFKAL